MNEETIVIETHRYQWKANDGTYVDSIGAYWSKENLFGSYGAKLNDDGKWSPVRIPADSDRIEFADESFENPIDAIRWCNLFFS